MRKLTIRRKKSFVGCLAKMQVYIEDTSANDIEINNISCRKLGDLKNNEEKTFEIGEDSAKIFVIADKLSKDYCNDVYRISAGQEDVILSGINKFNPANGNAFLFDNNESEDVKQNRKKGAKKGLLVLCIAIIAGALVGYIFGSGLFSGAKAKPKVFSENGMSITLTNEFKQTKTESYTNCYDSAHVAVFALKESFALAKDFEKYTVEQYGELVLQSNNLSSSKLKDIDGLTGFEYESTNPDTKETFKYVSFVYKSKDAFWLVQFAVRTADIDEYGAKITDWAKTVSFQ